VPPLPHGVTIPELERFFYQFRSQLPVPARCDPINAQDVATFFATATSVIAEAEIREREVNRFHANQFNVFSLIDPDENKLSDILADLLNPRGQHGQGNRFLRLLLEQLGIIGGNVATETVRVEREAPTHGIRKYRRRIDILVESAVIVAIENKIYSLEQYDQVRDYLDHLCVLSNGWKTPATLIYLTPNGRYPESLAPEERLAFQAKGHLQCWSYSRELRHWLGSCRGECEADKIRHFLADFASYIDSIVKWSQRPEEEDEAE
jgi:PD-(D/E)XK nuclease superfamily